MLASSLRSSIAPFLAALILPLAAHGTVFNVSPGDDIQLVVSGAMPGDEIVFAGGSYVVSSDIFVGVSGTAVAPIVIRAADGEVPVLLNPGASFGWLFTVAGTHLVFRGLELTGGDTAFILTPTASFITIEDCYIHDMDDVAIDASSASGNHEGIRILRNEIFRITGPGEGIRVGCSAGSCQVFNSVIEGNFIHGVFLAPGIELLPGSYANTIRDNVVFDVQTNAIEVSSTLGNGGPNVVERNVTWGSGSRIEGVADVTIRNNVLLSGGVFLGTKGGVLPANAAVTHNTLIGATFELDTCATPCTVDVANNALYASTGDSIRGGAGLTSFPTVSSNIGDGTVSGLTLGPSEFDDTGDLATDFVAANLTGAPPNDVFPASGSLLVGAADPAYLAPDDFNAQPRTSPGDVGAYLFDPAGNLGWAIQAGFKALSGCPLSPDLTDTDGDGTTDPCDEDDDGDGIRDDVETNVGSEPLLADSDGDGADDGQDSCILQPDATQTDTDGDGRGDVCDAWNPADLGNATPRTIGIEFELSLDDTVVGQSWANRPLDAQLTSAGDQRTVTLPAASWEPLLVLGGAPVVPGTASDWVGVFDAVTGDLQAVSWTYQSQSDLDTYRYLGSSVAAGGIDSSPFGLGVFCSPLPCETVVPNLPYDTATGEAHGIGGLDIPLLNGFPPPNDVFAPSDIRLSELVSGVDTDGDGLDNEVEVGLGTDPIVADSDGDGLSDGDEVNLWFTDPTDDDSDDDGFLDGADNCPNMTGTDPLDADGDGLGDMCDNCRRTPNLTQEDGGGFGGPGADGTGDLCQNGDFNDDGVVDILDTVLMRRRLADLPVMLNEQMPPEN